eukprot:7027289-Alexandrium_andersonii.AAC.1
MALCSAAAVWSLVRWPLASLSRGRSPRRRPSPRRPRPSPLPPLWRLPECSLPAGPGRPVGPSRGGLLPSGRSSCFGTAG